MPRSKKMPRSKNMWRAACRAKVLGADAPLAASVGGAALALWRAEDGRPVAFTDRCAHMPLPLSTGRCERGRLQCRYHGLEYDPSGKVTGVYSHAIDDGRRAQAWPAMEKYGRVWVWMGDAAQADEARIAAARLRQILRFMTPRA